MLYYIKLSGMEDAYLEEIINNNGRPEEIRYTSAITRAKIYEDEEMAKRDAGIIPVIFNRKTSGIVTPAT